MFSPLFFQVEYQYIFYIRLMDYMRRNYEELMKVSPFGYDD